MLASIPATADNGGRLYVDADAILFAAADVFARNPHLAKHLINLILAHKAKDEVFSPFFHLFEAATSAAGGGGAEDYRFGYRLRAPEQSHFAVGAKADSEVPLNGHGITPQMIEAGFQVLCNSGIADEYLGADRQLVAEIYLAMAALAIHAAAESFSL
jgi:hypothetical protein